MSEKKIVVPEGLWEAVVSRYKDNEFATEFARVIITNALAWLDGELDNLTKPFEKPFDPHRCASMMDSYQDAGYKFAIADVRRMFVVPEPKFAEEQLQGMEDAAKLFDGQSFGPYYHPALKIREYIAEARQKSK